MPENEDFYEDDEPVEDIVAAWKSGEMGTTAPPMFVVSVQTVSTGLMFPVPPGAIGVLVTDGPINRGSLVAC